MAARNDAPLPLVTVLANADCPHCTHATDTITQWCAEHGIPVAGLDLKRHPEAAERWSIEQSPSIVLERGREARVFPGFPTRDEFLEFAAPL